MKHAELFAGYGGLSLAVEAAFGAELAWYAEHDPAPSKIMARHWPDVPNHHDVTQIDWHDVEPVDIISGGSPCQDVSAAGRRAGMNEGTRSNLWVAMREAIAQIKPTYVIWENVRGAHSASAYSAVESEPGLLGDDRAAYLRATGRVLGDLANLGYDAQWRTISAASIGAPHKRERVFVLAWRRDASAEDRDGRRAGRGTAAPGQSGGGRQDAQALVPTGASGGTGATEPVTLLPTVVASQGDTIRASQSAFSDLGRTLAKLLPTHRASHGDKGGPNQRDSAGAYDLPAISNLLPTPLTTDSTINASPAKFRRESPQLGAMVTLLPTVEARSFKGRNGGAGKGFSADINHAVESTDFGTYSAAIRRWEHVLGRPAPPPTELSPRGRHRLSEHFTEWMMGLPQGWICDTPGITRRDAIKAAGNGVVPAQATAALQDMLQHVPATKEAA